MKIKYDKKLKLYVGYIQTLKVRTYYSDKLKEKVIKNLTQYINKI